VGRSPKENAPCDFTITQDLDSVYAVDDVVQKRGDWIQAWEDARKPQSIETGQVGFTKSGIEREASPHH